MVKNAVKDLLQRGRNPIGTWVFSSPDIVELVGVSGFDFVVIDSEHAPKGVVEIEQCVRAANAAGVTPIVRVSANEPNLILRVLEAGAQGVIVPFIQTADAARRAVAAAKYPPDGERGSFGYTRAARYGSVPMAEHVTSSNREILVIGLVEDLQGLQNVDEIAASGLDIIFVGHSDFAAALGVPGQKDHPRVSEAIQQVVEAANRNGVWLMSGVIDIDHLRELRASGFHAFTYHHEYQILAAAYRAVLPQLRAATESVSTIVDANGT